MMALSNPIQDELAALAHALTPLIEQVHHEYNKYFSGAEKKPPVRLRSNLEKQMNRATALKRQCQSYALNFKVQNLFNKYLTYRTLWDRKLKQLEDLD